MNTKQLAASLVLLSLVTTSLARAEGPNDSQKPKASVASKPAKKKAAPKKKKMPVEVAAAAEPRVEPEPVKPSEPSIAELPKAEPRATEPAPKLDADKPQEDRSATRNASEKPITIAPLVGFASEGLRLGFGARAGYTIPTGGNRDGKGGGVYVGGAFMYHLGFSVDTPYASYSFSAFYPSAEAGYEFRPMDRLSIRPYGGVGVLFGNTTAKGGFAGQETEKSMSSSSLAIYPGCTVNYDIPNSSFFAGGDARVLIPVEGLGASFGMFASAGMRF